MKKSIRSFLGVLVILAISCHKSDPGPVAPTAGLYTLPLMETTDLHGYVVSTGNNAVQYRLAQIAGHAEYLREKGKDRLVLLDGGDLYQGASVSNLLSGWPVYVSYDRMGYDAVALGNHDFDWGVEQTVDADATLPDYQWQGQSCANLVPVVCANLYRNGQRDPRTLDYVILEKSAVNAKGAVIPVRIGVVGFAVNYAKSIIATQFIDKGYSIRADFDYANSIAARLEDSGQCDATVLLIHGAADYAAGSLGQDTPFDLVLGGHSHATRYGNTDWGLAYLQGGRYGEHYAYTDLTFYRDEDGSVSFRYASRLNILTPETSGKLSADIQAVSDEALAACEQELNEVIGYIDVDATNQYLDYSGKRATALGNWACDITRSIGETDVAFVNGGGIRTSFPLNGNATRDITVADIYELFPFSNPIYVYRITYADLLQLLQYALTDGGEALFTLMTGVNCAFTSGREIHTITGPDNYLIYRDGKWIGDWARRTLTLAVSEYLATTERTDYTTGLPNPLLEWNQTDRLLSNDRVDNIWAIQVLRQEAAASGGLLSIDTRPHFMLLKD